MIAAAMDIADYLIHPAVQALLLAVLSTALVLWRRPRLACVLGILAAAWLAIASTPALALHLRNGLVTGMDDTSSRADAIVVLGGGVLPDGDWSRTTTRAGMGLSLWRAGKAPVLIASGNDQAVYLARGFAASGVPTRDLRVEDASTDTHENARDTAAILRNEDLHRIVLVTSDIHMRRAAACFRREGVHVIESPADDALTDLVAASTWLPRRDALTLTARCLHEYVALWMYRQRHWMT
jgi:uncharacterized SAM-binding protein YcdF (DUF218 family)